MIKREEITINGKTFIRNYSDDGRYLIQNETGRIYSEAIDVETASYTYTESDEEIELSAEEALELILGGAAE